MLKITKNCKSASEKCHCEVTYICLSPQNYCKFVYLKARKYQRNKWFIVLRLLKTYQEEEKFATTRQNWIKYSYNNLKFNIFLHVLDVVAWTHACGRRGASKYTSNDY